VDRLLEFVEPDHTVMDVGAGGGRLALPLALKCRSLVAVEPSESMASVLTQQAQESGIENVSVVQNEWQDATVDPVDIVLCAHVLYTIRDIGAFLNKLDAHAKKTVLVVIHNAPPQSQIYPLWKDVHGKERLALPSLPQLKEVLDELEINYQADPLPPQPARGFDTLEQAISQLSQRLYLADGSPEAQRLEQILPGLLIEEEGVLHIRDAEPLRPTLVSWHPTNGP
jgi:SAM-dependent methyltransferase